MTTYRWPEAHEVCAAARLVVTDDLEASGFEILRSHGTSHVFGSETGLCVRVTATKAHVYVSPDRRPGYPVSELALHPPRAALAFIYQLDHHLQETA